MNRRAHLLALLAVTAVVLAAAGCAGDQQATPEVAAPSGAAALPALRRQANMLLDGGTVPFRARIDGLRGHPIVVNQWASWCGPCRVEFPFFASAARRLERRVAFIGVNSQDSADAARKFLKRYPVPFPHFSDPDGKVGRVFRGGRAMPTTAFYRADGELAFTHVGSYADEQALDEDIRKYALDD